MADHLTKAKKYVENMRQCECGQPCMSEVEYIKIWRPSIAVYSAALDSGFSNEEATSKQMEHAAKLAADWLLLGKPLSKCRANSSERF